MQYYIKLSIPLLTSISKESISLQKFKSEI